jgi:hypothetical protein
LKIAAFRGTVFGGENLKEHFGEKQKNLNFGNITQCTQN